MKLAKPYTPFEGTELELPPSHFEIKDIIAERESYGQVIAKLKVESFERLRKLNAQKQKNISLNNDLDSLEESVTELLGNDFDYPNPLDTVLYASKELERLNKENREFKIARKSIAKELERIRTEASSKTKFHTFAELGRLIVELKGAKK